MSWHASSGLRAWAIQRLSAVYIGLFMLYFVGHELITPVTSYEQWIAWIAHPIMNVGLGLFFIALLLHAWVGIRDVIMDYISAFAWRAGVLSVIMLILGALGLWVLKILFTVAAYGNT